MVTESACLSYPYSIQNHHFSSDFRLLEVKGYDIILGADWIFLHSPVGLDLKTRELSITHYGNSIITFKDESVPDKHMLIRTRKLCNLPKRKAVSSVAVLNRSDNIDTALRNPNLQWQYNSCCTNLGTFFKSQLNYHQREQWIMPLL